MSEAAPPKRKSLENQEEIAKKSRLETNKSTKPAVVAPIKLNLNAQSDEEEIPEEAKIRMRNLGRYTPTSSGPNSYGKGRYGFIDRRALLNRQTDAINSLVSDDDKVAE